MGVAAAIGIGGSILQGVGQAQAGRAEARAGRANAQAAERQARELLKRAKVNQQVTRDEGISLQATQVSAFARGGVDVGSGSPLDVLENTASNVRKEVFNIEQEAQFQAGELLRGAAASRSAARSATRAANIGIAGTVLGAGLQVSKLKFGDATGATGGGGRGFSSPFPRLTQGDF